MAPASGQDCARRWPRPGWPRRCWSASSGPASAHVTTDPGSAPQGGEITLGFRVPNEMAAANVTQVQIAFPTDHPLLGVDTEPIAGWTSKVTEVKLNPPVQTDDGPVSQAVSQITWTAASGGGTGPGQFQEFPVLVQRLPSNVDQVAFPAIQTYSDGAATSWIDPVDAGHPNPDHPRPCWPSRPRRPARPGRRPSPPLLGRPSWRPARRSPTPSGLATSVWPPASWLSWWPSSHWPGVAPPARREPRSWPPGIGARTGAGSGAPPATRSGPAGWPVGRKRSLRTTSRWNGAPP